MKKSKIIDLLFAYSLMVLFIGIGAGLEDLAEHLHARTTPATQPATQPTTDPSTFLQWMLTPDEPPTDEVPPEDHWPFDPDGPQPLPPTYKI